MVDEVVFDVVVVKVLSVIVQVIVVGVVTVDVNCCMFESVMLVVTDD